MSDVSQEKSPAPDAEHPRDLLPSYALGLLEGAEQEQVEAHVRNCPTCTADLHELRGVLDALPLAAAPVTPPPAARQALLDRVAATIEVQPEKSATTRRTGAPVQPAARAGSWGGAGWASAGWGVALACAIVAGVSTWQTVSARRELATMRQEQASTEAALRQQIDVLSQFDPQTTRIAAVRGAPPASGITGRLLYQPNGSTAVALLDHLPELPAGKVYQLWLIQGATPVSAGIMEAGPNGSGSLVIRAPGNIGSYSGFGITAEPAPGVAAPTGAILASATL